jgi:hypothetical protein
MLKSVAACSSLLICSVHLSAQYGEAQAVVIPDTTVPFDTAWYNHLWDSIPHSQIPPGTEVTEGDSSSQNETFTYPWFGDSTMVQTTTYTVIVTEPNPCVDPALSQPATGLAPLIVDFTGARSYPWYPSISWELSSCYATIAFPPAVQNPHNIDLLDQDTAQTTSTSSSFSATNARQISSSPPPAIPDPPTPAPVPEQPWYQAVLPNPIRVRKS